MPAVRAKRRRFTPKKKIKIDEVHNEINVTPLVDVCLVLLIIFMVILPLMERGRKVELPQTRHHAKSEDTQQPIVVIEKSGKVYVDKDEVPDLATMQERVQEEWKALRAQNSQLGKKGNERHGEGRVLVKAEVGTRYGEVYPVVMALHDVGAVGIDLGTNEQKERKE